MIVTRQHEIPTTGQGDARDVTVLLECDTRPRHRELVVQVAGE